MMNFLGQNKLVTAMALGVAVLATTCADAADARETPAKEDDTMSATAITIAGAYYDLFRHAGSMTEVPMRDDLTFTSPRFRLASAEAFRAALNDLLPRVANFRMQSQFHDDATVVTFYELDLGAPGGPIAMAERLRVDEGRLTAVDLIFDSARLPAPPER